MREGQGFESPQLHQNTSSAAVSGILIEEDPMASRHILGTSLPFLAFSPPGLGRPGPGSVGLAHLPRLEPAARHPAAVCAYLVERAEQGVSFATISLTSCAIAYQHRRAGAVDPTAHEAVRQVRRRPGHLARRPRHCPRAGVHQHAPRRPRPAVDLRRRHRPDPPCPRRGRRTAHRPDHRPLPARRPHHQRRAGRHRHRTYRRPNRHKRIDVLIERYIRPIEALRTTSSRDLGL